jgi:hypothetical protein
MPSITPPAVVAPAPSSSGGDVIVFSEAEYAANPEEIVAYAAATGRAVVVGADGRPRVIITIPMTELPTLEY